MFAFHVSQLGFPTNQADYEQFVGALEALGLDFARRLPGVDDTLPVPTCPAWTVRDLVAHMGMVCGWGINGIGSLEEAQRDRSLPEGDLATWLGDKHGRFVAKLKASPFDLPSWSFAEPHNASFWARRMMGEFGIHLYDLATAIAPEAPEWEVPEQLAVDGVSEVFATMYPRQIRLGRREPLEQGLTVVVALSSGEKQEFSIPGSDADQGRLAVEMAADDAYLAVWGRHPSVKLPALTS